MLAGTHEYRVYRLNKKGNDLLIYIYIYIG